MNRVLFSRRVTFFLVCVSNFTQFTAAKAAPSNTGGHKTPAMVIADSGQSQAIAEIEARGGKVVRDPSDPRRPAISVVFTGVDGRQFTGPMDADMQLLKGLDDLNLGTTQVTDNGLEALRESRQQALIATL
jgi:hypothetical protein